MRDRRNTNLSTSSSSSSSSTLCDSSTSSPTLSSSSTFDLFSFAAHEKRYSSPPPSYANAFLAGIPIKDDALFARRSSIASLIPRRRRLFPKIVMLVIAVLLFWRYLSGYLTLSHQSPMEMADPVDQAIATSADASDSSNALLLDDDALLETPAAIYLPTTIDEKSRKTGAKWTISIPPNTTFPLSTEEYHEICSDARVFAEGIATNDHEQSKVRRKHGRWYGDGRSGGTKAADISDETMASYLSQTFLDVREAQRIGYLPPSEIPESNASAPATIDNVCPRSVTFVLSESDISFGSSLLNLWLAYSLAKSRNRAFFLDDSRWAWGSYANYFQPLPQAVTPTGEQCIPPPREWIVPCPLSADHIVMSGDVPRWLDWTDLTSASERSAGLMSWLSRSHSHKCPSHRERQIFNHLHTGYEALFHLADEDADYVTERVRNMQSSLNSDDTSTTPAPIIGLHIRRGDLHPWEFQYAGDYLPLGRFIDVASELSQSLSPATSPTSMLLASDDPDLIHRPELQLSSSSSTILRAQDRILLATKSTLDRTAAAQPQHDPSTPAYYRKLAPENAGWDGGFYRGVFTNVPDMQLRTFVGRAYLLDIAVLASASDGVVCGAKSASCRVLGVAMGWDAVRGSAGGGRERMWRGRFGGYGGGGDGKDGGEGRKMWRNVDDGRTWSWDGR